MGAKDLRRCPPWKLSMRRAHGLDFEQACRVCVASPFRDSNPIRSAMVAYGRLNIWCGSLDYEIESGRYVLGTMNRRDTADGLRALPDDAAIPSEQEIADFEKFIRGRTEGS